MSKVGGIRTPYDDCIVPAPTAKSGEGNFGTPVEGLQGPTESPIKPVQYANIEGGKSGGKGFGGGTEQKTVIKG